MSKGLDALKYLKENKRRHWLDNDNSTECLDIIEQELQAFEIIKMCIYDICFLTVNNNKYYIKINDFEVPIEKEEYNLLKEVLL